MKTDRNENIEGYRAMGHALKDLSASTKTEMCSFFTGTVTTIQSTSAQKLNLEMHERGVRSRAIYLQESLADHPTFNHLHWTLNHGSEIRVLPTLPLQMTISDQHSVIIPRNPGEKDYGITIYRDKFVVAGLVALFEQTWVKATPLDLFLINDQNPISDEDRLILDLLSLGRTDKEIAQTLGISMRSVQRKVQELLVRLNADSRFAAGAEAVRRNWI